MLVVSCRGMIRVMIRVRVRVRLGLGLGLGLINIETRREYVPRRGGCTNCC